MRFSTSTIALGYLAASAAAAPLLSNGVVGSAVGVVNGVLQCNVPANVIATLGPVLSALHITSTGQQAAAELLHIIVTAVDGFIDTDAITKFIQNTLNGIVADVTPIVIAVVGLINSQIPCIIASLGSLN
ncbi:hypothetical protein H4R18_001632 [Coemansia javaensis]|uniref:Uncharacterized protein n=1 Tax=Coemansia javaensis TaxID=2761396 RepID=A0A9W8HEG2_9FUNG|nr:hypothetical protein H4R18_001632 [Coemansia javaensis]